MPGRMHEKDGPQKKRDQGGFETAGFSQRESDKDRARRRREAERRRRRDHEDEETDQ